MKEYKDFRYDMEVKITREINNSKWLILGNIAAVVLLISVAVMHINKGNYFQGGFVGLASTANIYSIIRLIKGIRNLKK